MLKGKEYLFSMAALSAMLFFSCKDDIHHTGELLDDDTPEDTTASEIRVSPKVIDYCMGYSQFAAERFSACTTKQEILDECTRILSQDAGDITLGGFGGYLVLDLGSEPRDEDYTFHFKGNGFDDHYCLVSASDDGENWSLLNSTEELSYVELSYVKNRVDDFYTWTVDTVKNCRKIGVKEICTTKTTYDWDTTAIWSKVIDGVKEDIKPNSGNTPVVYVKAHPGPYFKEVLSTPSGWVPRTRNSLCDSFVVRKEDRYLKFQNAFDSISPVVGEFSPEIEKLSILLAK